VRYLIFTVVLCTCLDPFGWCVSCVLQWQDLLFCVVDFLLLFLDHFNFRYRELRKKEKELQVAGTILSLTKQIFHWSYSSNRSTYSLIASIVLEASVV
jgi:hypothetical protein